MIRLRDGLPVLWRQPGVAQVGTDPRCGVVLDGLAEAELDLLDLLPDGVTQDDLLRHARERGVPHARVRAIVAALARAGVLLPEGATGAERHRPPHPSATLAADAAYWARLRPDGDGWSVLDRRAERVVGVLGADRLGMLVAGGLAAAGVGTVLLSDPAPVTARDVAPGAFGPADVGRARQDAGAVALRQAVPRVRTTAPPGTRPDLCVLLEHRVASPVRARPLVREDVPHLSVVVADVDLVVGPLVRPGLGPCLRCLDLHRCDADERWPVLATQLAVRPPGGVEASLAALGAAVAVTQVLAHLDGRETVTLGATLELGAHGGESRLRRWAPHPECGCGGHERADAPPGVSPLTTASTAGPY